MQLTTGKEWLGVMAWTSFAVWMFGPGGILELDTIIWMTLVLGPVFWMQLLTRQRAGRVTAVGGAMSSLLWNQADPINVIYEIADQVGGHAGHASRQLAAPARGMPWSWKFASMMGAPWGVRGEENESGAMVWPGHTEGPCLYDPELPDPDPFPLEIAFLAGAMVVLALLHVLLRWMYPNQWGPGRDVRIRRFFNSADITMGLAFAVTAGLGTGGRTTTCLWCVAVVCTLRSFGIHSPRPLCAIQTFFLGLGIGQRLLPAWNALMIGQLCWLVMSVVIILWALDVLPFGWSKDEKEDRYVSKLADLRPGAMLVATSGLSVVEGEDVAARVVSVGKRDHHGVRVTVKAIGGPESMWAAHPDGIIKVHLCAPGQRDPLARGKCGAFSKSDGVYHVKSKYWRIEDEKGAGSHGWVLPAGQDGVRDLTEPVSAKERLRLKARGKAGAKSKAKAKKKAKSSAPIDLAPGEELDPDYDDGDDSDSDDDGDDDFDSEGASGTASSTSRGFRSVASKNSIRKPGAGDPVPSQRERELQESLDQSNEAVRRINARMQALESSTSVPGTGGTQSPARGNRAFCVQCVTWVGPENLNTHGVCGRCAATHHQAPGGFADHGNYGNAAAGFNVGGIGGVPYAAHDDGFFGPSDERDFYKLPPARPPGWHTAQVIRSGREAMGLSESTMAMYIASHHWRKTTKGLRSHALIIAKALDLHTARPPRDLEAWDLLATRLRALIHVNATGDWDVAEALQSDLGRDTGLVSSVELYRAKKEASLTKGTRTSAEGADRSDSDRGERRQQPKKKQRPGKKHRDRKRQQGDGGGGEKEHP